MTAAFLMQLSETLTIISSVMGFFAIIAGVKHTGIFRKMGVFGFVSEAVTMLFIAVYVILSMVFEMEAGMNAHLAKPLDVKKLMSTIARLSASSSGSVKTDENN